MRQAVGKGKHNTLGVREGIFFPKNNHHPEDSPFYSYFLDHLIMLNEFHKLVIWRRTGHSNRTRWITQTWLFIWNFIILKINQQYFPRPHLFYSTVWALVSVGEGGCQFSFSFFPPLHINNLYRRGFSRPQSLWKSIVNTLPMSKCHGFKHRTPNKKTNWPS